MSVVLCTHPPFSPAVQRCCDARNQVIERDRNMPPEELPDAPKDPKDLQAQMKFQSDTMILLDSLDHDLAFRTAMPEPCGRRNIKNFVICVTHGVAIGAIDPTDARNMLYAARTAILTIAKHKKPKDRKKPVTSAPVPTEHEMYLEVVKNRSF
jgi:hypothetical protein